MTIRNLLTIGTLAFALPLAGLASSYTFSNHSLGSLAHGTAYTWGLYGSTYNQLQAALHSGQVVTGARLMITNLDDWRNEPNDVLYVNVLNGVLSGTHSYAYNPYPSFYDTSYGANYFDASSTHLSYDPATSGSLLVYTGLYNTSGNPGTWSDPDSPSNPYFDMVIDFTPANLSVLSGFLTADYGSSSDFLGLGFDPNCHYYDCGVKLCIQTGDKVPDSGTTIVLLALGILTLFMGKLLTCKSCKAS